MGRTGLFGTQSFASRRKNSGCTGDLNVLTECCDARE
jgi:hypothetical protein